MDGRTGLLLVWLAALLVSSSAAAIGIATTNDDFTLEISPAIQTRIQVDADGPPPTKDVKPGSPGTAAPSGDPNFDLFIRRARVLIRATGYKYFGFTVNIVSLQIGQRGAPNSTPFLQDAIFR